MGIFAWILFQTFSNIGMVTSLLPVIGLTLPFFSAGGTSVVSLYLGLGVAMSVYMHNQMCIRDRRSAMTAAGAGKIGAYDCCTFETAGEGRFRPLAGSSPFLGKQGEVEVAREVRLEAICQRELLPLSLIHILWRWTPPAR